jgi:hypothetical protein
MADKSFPGQNNLSSQAETWGNLTPSDSVDFTFVPKAVQVSSTTGGQFVAVGADDVAGTFYGNPGQILPIRPKRINTTGMTGGMTFVGLKT